MIGVITVLARLVGFGRQVVFAHTVGTTCLGTAYTTANMVPNIIYDIVLGGALASVVVPVLAGPAGRRGRRGQADLVGAADLDGRAARAGQRRGRGGRAPDRLRAAFGNAAGCPRAELAGVGTRMLIVFAPQVLLYGLAVVLYGILQSHRRFGAPGAGAAAVQPGGGRRVRRVRRDRRGVRQPAALSCRRPPSTCCPAGRRSACSRSWLTAVVPAWRLRIGLAAQAAGSPPGSAPGCGRLALAGVLTLVAQDASVAVVIVLANRYGDPGALVLYGFAWAVFVVPYAVLAVPIATSTFPELSAASDVSLDAGSGSGVVLGGGSDRFDATAAASTRAVMLASWLGAAALAGARLPLARVFESHSASSASVLAVALAAFAPGLVGYGLSANLSRVLYARGRNRAPAVAIERRLAAGDRGGPADRAVRAAPAGWSPRSGSAPRSA